MFVSFLMPHVDRGAGPLFHLIMLLQMSRFAPDEVCFIGDDAYFDEKHVPFGEVLALGSLRFSCVSQERFRAYRKAAVPFAAVASLYAHERSHLDAFQALLADAHPPLSAAISSALDQLAVVRDEIEAFLTWSNCPSLSALAVELGKPVIHNELGPLRAPSYQDTVYFDFQGVNGNTTPARDWMDRDALAAGLDGLPALTGEALRRLLYCGPLPAAAGEGTPRYPLGVALQVEDDSNTLVYGRGYDAVRLLYRAQRDLAPEQVLVRSHPGARMGYRGGLGVCDSSPSSLAFLQRIDHLLTINSSVAAEAALWNIPYTVLGDTPFSVLSVPLNAPRAAAAPAPASNLVLNALLLGYLVPSNFLFDPDYYRWRLAGATLRDCIARHLEVLKRNATHVQAPLLPAPEAPAAAAAAVPAAASAIPHRNAALWTATRSLSRDADALQKRIAGLEAELLAAVAERDKNWDERCWFKTNLERLEQELAALGDERDTLRLALAKQQAETDVLKHCIEANADRAEKAQQAAVEALANKTTEQQAVVDAVEAETAALRALYGQTEQALAEMRQRFDKFGEELVHTRGRFVTAEAQGTALLDELHRTQRERIEALARGAGEPAQPST
jgi:predicted  nucleic acid-binding Zn-ribbon protein